MKLHNTKFLTCLHSAYNTKTLNECNLARKNHNHTDINKNLAFQNEIQEIILLFYSDGIYFKKINFTNQTAKFNIFLF